MKRGRRPIVWPILLLVVGVCGCGWSGSDEDLESDESIPELGLMSTDAVIQPAVSVEPGLELKLNVGQRFPFVKTIEQLLSQMTIQGEETSRSQLELMFEITVEQIQDDRKRLGVRYQRIRYQQDISGETFAYDSDSPSQSVPLRVQAYQGLVNNGFSFWIGQDNHIEELVGFQAFLERCVNGVPVERRQDVMTGIEQASGEEGIADFIDDSIGLLPYEPGEGDSGVVDVGHVWTRERHFRHPVPIVLTKKCTLNGLTETSAEIDIVGTVAPSVNYGGSNQGNDDFSMDVLSGHCFGRCTIDRKTGLPLDSRVERRLKMIVRSGEGADFEQQKRIVTTIRSVPQLSTAKTARLSSEPDPVTASDSPAPQVSDTSQGSGLR